MSVDFDSSSPWQVRLLGDVADITLGGTPATEVAGFWDGTIPWMSSGEVNKKQVFEVDGRITEAGLAASNATLVDPPTVAIGLAGQGKTRGTAALVHICVCTNQSIALIKGKSGTLDTPFLFHNLDRRYEELRSRSAGGGRAGLSREILQKIPIDFPGLPEQQRIAKALDTADEAIAKTEAVIAKLKQVRAGLLHDLLTRGLDESGQLRDPIAQSEQFLDSPLGRIPKEWEVAPFREYGSPDRPYLKTGPFGSSLKQEHWVEEGTPVITIGSLGEGEFLRSELLHISEKTAVELATYAVVPGDIVFSRVADVGRSVVVGEDERGWVMSSNIMWISVDRRRAVPQYVQATISSHPQVRGQIRRSLNSAGRDIANAPILNSIQLPWPRPDEQQRIAGAITSASTRIRKEERVLTKLLVLKQGLMSDLLTGRVRVPEGLA